MAIIKVVCDRCGSDVVTRDACTRWNVDSQEWEISATYDTMTCQSCEHESDDFACVQARAGQWIAAPKLSRPLSAQALALAKGGEPVPRCEDVALCDRVNLG